ncbi:MAG TPA: hypothetical protein VJU86_05190 [Pyrinomonadaceae bacterium]|nr:hypothetical protein [Pyrinomonadaceae bacterium]
MRTPSPNLINVLIAKSIAETILVGVLAVFAYTALVPPYFHGWGEVRDEAIVGWAVNNADPWGRVEVQLYVDDQLVGTQVASLSRPDVKAAGWSKDEWHGYAFPLPKLGAGVHTAGVYARHDSGGSARKSLQLLGDPIQFRVEPNGRLVPLPK